MLLRDYIRRASRCYPDKVAFIDGDLQLNWQEVHERTDRLSAALQALGVRKGDSVCIIAHEHIQMIEHWFACAKIGAIRVGVNWRYSAHEKLHIIRDSGAKVVLIQSNCVEAIAEHLHDLCLEGRTFVGFGGAHDLEYDYEKIVAAADTPDAVPLDRTDLIAFSYTTGTTGLPKGVMWSHGGVVDSLIHCVLGVGLIYDDVWHQPAPTPGMPIMLNSFGVINGLTTVLVGGDFSAERHWELVERHRVTAMGVIPTMLRRVLEQYKKGGYDASSVRRLVYGSSPMPPSLTQEVLDTFGWNLVQAYGSTESVGWVSYLRPDDHRRALERGEPQLLASCGRPSSHLDLMILRDDGTPAETGEVGEVCFRGTSLTVGYHNRPEEQKDLFFGEWLRMGDLGRLDENGYLFLVDRRKSMIITGGYNVYPVVIENVLSQHEFVREVAVFGTDHPEWGEAVMAYVSLRPDCEVSASDLIGFSHAKLGKWEVPKHIEFLPDLPKNVNGKIDKLALRQRLKVNPEVLPWVLSCTEN